MNCTLQYHPMAAWCMLTSKASMCDRYIRLASNSGSTMDTSNRLPEKLDIRRP